MRETRQGSCSTLFSGKVLPGTQSTCDFSQSNKPHPCNCGISPRTESPRHRDFLHSSKDL